MPGKILLFAQTRPDLLYAWRGPSVLVVHGNGQIERGGSSGFFFREARYLSELRLEIDGAPPFFCSAAEVDTNELEFSYIYPETEAEKERRKDLPHRSVDIRARYRVTAAGCGIELFITNRWAEVARIRVSWQVDADFADIGKLGDEKASTPKVSRVNTPQSLELNCDDPALPYSTHIRAEAQGGWTYEAGSVSTELELPRQSTAVARLQIAAIDRDSPIDEPGERRREEHLSDWHRRVTYVEAPGYDVLANITNRAVHDWGSLALLEGPEEEWMTPAAGIPLFADLWGRDALTASWQATMFDRGQMANAALSVLSRLQGQTDNAWRDEQPGRILRQVQRGPAARQGETPFERYYGDYAGPFAFLFTLGQLYAWSGDKNLLKKYWDNARRALDWATKEGDPDGDGYLEYETRSPKGPTHQGWKDSENAIVYADGRQVKPPIAPCEIQAYYYAALRFAGVFALALGHPADALHYRSAARQLKERFNRDFWMEDEDCVALGLDADKRQIRSVTSNAGHCLAAAIVDEARLPRLVRRIFQSDLFSGWGIRTLSTKNPAYNPLSYHLGSVWPVENATMVLGLRRFGFDEEALRLSRALYELALCWKDFRIPECVGGYDRTESGHPGAYPRANAPQTWNETTFPLVLQSILGLQPVAPLNLLALDPILPYWLPEVTLRDLRVGNTSVTIRFFRDDTGKSHFQVLQRAGNLHIVRQPPLDSLTTSLWDRFGALLDTGS
jgi:glycogen debranching enzyme